MNIVEIESRTPELLARLLEVWEASVRATHLFLSPGGIEAVKVYVPQALREAGARDAFFRLKTLYPNVCLVHLHALEGAIRDVDCNRLPEEVREDLRAFNDDLKGKGGPTP